MNRPTDRPSHALAVYTIPPTMPFVDALAAGLLARHGTGPLGLSAVTVLVPTRRAVRALGEAFLRQSDAPLLLPAMRPIGDVDEEELDLGSFAAELDLTLPPAISGLHRQLFLAKRILDRGVAGAADDPGQAARLASQLARLLDQVHSERLSFADLAGLVPADYATHWQITLEFLTIVTEYWPAILDELGLMDPAERRDRMIAEQADRWRAAPPDGPVYLAGSTGSQPATAALMAVVAEFTEGGLVLPGLDTAMDAKTWAAVGEEPTHPQFGLHQLLAQLAVDRAAVAEWPAPGITSVAEQRTRLIAQALAPAAATDRWHELPSPDRHALDGLARIDCPGPQEEAGAIALALREALETPGRTAALVTPDRTLARRVAAELRRWRIEIDDSAGVPLSHTAPGTLLNLTAAMMAEDLAPVALLAALKHPLAAGATAPAVFRGRVRALERLVLRGPRPAPGFAGLFEALAGAEVPNDGGASRELRGWLDRLRAAARPFADLLARDTADPADLLAAHVAFVDWLSTTDSSGAGRIWLGGAGEAVATLIDEVAEAVSEIGPISGRSWPGLLDSLMADRAVRPRIAAHPRLHIWGLLEARLQRADLVVLGGLNEGTWPPGPRTDPWLSRPMRGDFGLPQPERRIGQSAHDFTQLANARQVMLTRATKVDGTPTVPSRWLLRLESLLADRDRPRGGDPHLDWQRAIDVVPESRPVEPPAPCPPVAARPRRLSVTQVETLIRDPYSIYARHILGLRPLDPIGADPGAAERGTIIHDALERFVKDVGAALPMDALDRLLQHGREAFGADLTRPAVEAFWWPRFRRAAEWFIGFQRERAAEMRESRAEARGELELPAAGGPFVLTAKADRIDRLTDGSYAILDYKTGQLPSNPQVVSGLSPQLALEAAIATAGGFEGLAEAAVSALIYVRLSGGDPAGEASPIKADAGELATDAASNLARLITTFDDARTPYRARPRPMWASRFGDYDHLARLKEWSATGGEDQ